MRCLRSNLARLNLFQAKPPEYPVKRISVPVALFSSDGDAVADRADVTDLVKTLGSTVILDYLVPVPKFRHNDFILGCKATDVLHDVMMATLARHNRKNV
ncbi:hypothetical protein HPB49_022490 [Dermacentor silvarum]|uniref:Uncharacterized protein n=1 Tax=Dermacentor silvarum TaxID=543639 RepID=A0ACB8C5S9_DERSI|nr:hypothetical protein HPB49_022490 [Dermacentor silvarum]